MRAVCSLIALTLCTPVPVAMAQERVELESIIIKGNREFPQILYIVPWKDMKVKGHREQTLVLYSLFGDLFDPVYEEAVASDYRLGTAGK